MVRRTLVVAAAIVLAAGMAYAQGRATLILRNGQRVNGTLVASSSSYDVINNQFNVRTGFRDQTYPAGDVVAISFSGGTPSQSELSQLAQGETMGGPNVMVMRDGQIISDTPTEQRLVARQELAELDEAQQQAKLA